jgi:tetrahydromethanopterin S-methyltransferase subunit F
MGEKTSVVTRRAQEMMESIRANRKFIARRRLIMAGKAA